MYKKTTAALLFLLFFTPSFAEIPVKQEEFYLSILVHPPELPYAAKASDLFIDCSRLEVLRDSCHSHNLLAFQLLSLSKIKKPVKLYDLLIFLQQKPLELADIDVVLKTAKQNSERLYRDFKDYSLEKELESFETALPLLHKDESGCLVNLTLFQIFLPAPVVFELNLPVLTCSKNLFYSRATLKKFLSEYTKEVYFLLSVNKKSIERYNSLWKERKNCEEKLQKKIIELEKCKKGLEELSVLDILNGKTHITVKSAALFNLSTEKTFYVDRSCVEQLQVVENLLESCREGVEKYKTTLNSLLTEALKDCIYIKINFYPDIKCSADANSPVEIISFWKRMKALRATFTKRRKDLKILLFTEKEKFAGVASWLIANGFIEEGLYLQTLLDKFDSIETVEELKKVEKKIAYELLSRKKILNAIKEYYLLRKSAELCNISFKGIPEGLDLTSLLLSLPGILADKNRLQALIDSCSKVEVSCLPEIPIIGRDFPAFCKITAINPLPDEKTVEVHLPYIPSDRKGASAAMKIKVPPYSVITVNKSFSAVLPAYLEYSSGILTILTPYAGRAAVCLDSFLNASMEYEILYHGSTLRQFSIPGCKRTVELFLTHTAELYISPLMYIEKNTLKNLSERNITLILPNGTKILLQPKTRREISLNFTIKRPEKQLDLPEPGNHTTLSIISYNTTDCALPEEILLEGLRNGLPQPVCGKGAQMLNMAYRDEALKALTACTSSTGKILAGEECRRAISAFKKENYLKSLYYAKAAEKKATAAKELVLDGLSLLGITVAGGYFALKRLKRREEELEI